MKKTIRFSHLITMTAILVSRSLTALSQNNPVGEFENHADIGSPKIKGSTTYDTATQEYTLAAGGTNMWYGTDQFHFAWKKMKGDFILHAKVEFIGKGVDPHRKLGWIARSTLDADSPYVDCAEHGDGLTSLQYRPTKGANTQQITLTLSNANVLQFERRGDTYIFSAAKYGEPFVSAQLTNVTLGEEVFAGLYLCSHNGDAQEKAIFRDVRIIKPVKAGFVPYRDYIGSHLEILDVHSGKLELIYSAAQPFEAPNWTTDGKALIYNISGRAQGWGRLVRFDLATKQTAIIDTGFAIQNNNDHVLSFDGKMLGISHHSTDHNRQSTIFTLPVEGGTPKLITPLTPSYLHGWSPDAKWLVYTGGRSNKYDIYKIPSDGSGQEIRLTTSAGLSDGPEFTPDGKYIYFNSTRTGKMQLWRMKPDGSDQEQVTNDEFNNWFPHISPDGKWIAFLSYLGDINPTDHPYYKHVYLRLMPFEGGAAKTIAYVYGGQGTINVPSWSPDSRKIAFVSNSAMD
jgi:TolB protein